MTKDTVALELNREAVAARDLIAGLRDDPDLAHDTVEGETNLFEAIDAALREIDECDVIITGCKAKEEEMAARRDRAERRREKVRTLIEQAILVARIDERVKRPTATISVASVPPKPIVTDESLVPSEYWRQPDPVLDKTKLNAAVKDGAEIPGVTMSNGGTKLQIRRA